MCLKCQTTVAAGSAYFDHISKETSSTLQLRGQGTGQAERCALFHAAKQGLSLHVLVAGLHGGVCDKTVFIPCDAASRFTSSSQHSQRTKYPKHNREVPYSLQALSSKPIKHVKLHAFHAHTQTCSLHIFE